MTKTKGWDWEHSWLAFSLFGYIVFPVILSFIFAPGFVEVLLAQESRTLLWILLLGMIYGVSNLAFGLGLKYLGFSLGYSISLGMMMAFGILIPPAVTGQLSEVLASSSGTMLTCGVLVAFVGVAVSSYAGYLKDKVVDLDKSEFNFAKGIIAALTVGIAGAAQPLATEQGAEIYKQLVEVGVNPLFQTLPVYMIIYLGAFITTIFWCLYRAMCNGRGAAFVCSGVQKIPLRKNYILCSLAGFLWFINFLFYGMGKSRMGEFSFTAWGILMSLTIVCGTLWGVSRGEWKIVTQKNRVIMYVGLVILTVASFIIGVSTN